MATTVQVSPLRVHSVRKPRQHRARTCCKIRRNLRRHNYQQFSKIAERTEAEQKDWDRWADGKSPIVRELHARFDPNVLYRYAETGQRCTVTAFLETGTVNINISGRYNKVDVNKTIQNVDPSMLEECDLPGPDEELGTKYTKQEDIARYVSQGQEGLGRVQKPN